MLTMDFEAAYKQAQEEIRSLEQELKVTREAVDGKTAGTLSWLQSKSDRQRVALRSLNRRVVAQRFVLRTLEGLGRGLTKEEREAALETDAKAADVDQKTLVTV